MGLEWEAWNHLSYGFCPYSALYSSLETAFFSLSFFLAYIERFGCQDK
jgi:hypothetical protein